jgi:hypothetical protein
VTGRGVRESRASGTLKLRALLPWATWKGTAAFTKIEASGLPTRLWLRVRVRAG